MPVLTNPWWQQVSKPYKANIEFSDDREIFLSDSTLDTRPDLTQFSSLAANPLLSVGNCYDKKTGKLRVVSSKGKKDPFTILNRAIKASKCAAGDSGGFQILMGKLPRNLDPRITVQIYKKAGFRQHDKPIQLDLPPPYDLSLEDRLSLIHQSALNYHIMATKLPTVIPVVHGWTEQELRQSFEWLCDPDKLAIGSNLATGTRTKARMSSAAGACLQSNQFVNDFVNPSHNKQKFVTPACLTESHMTYALDHVKSNSLAVGTNISSNRTFALDHVKSIHPHTYAIGTNLAASVDQAIDIIRENNGHKVTAIGSNLAAGKNYVFDHIRKQGENKARQRVPMKVILTRWAKVANLLKDWDLIENAGSLGQSLHYQHFGFLAGFKWGDSSSWRLKSYMGEIAMPYIEGKLIGGWRHVGLRKARKGRKISHDEKKILRQLLNDPSNPLSIYSMTPDYFLELVRYNMPQWKDTRPIAQWPIKPFETRCIWNAWIFKHWEQDWANQFAHDPDKYYKALFERFSTPGFGRLRNELKFFWTQLKQAYVQTSLDIYLTGEVHELLKT